MKASQVRLDKLEPDFCEYSEPLGSYYRCKLTDFGFIRRCTVEDRKSCPDLVYFRKHKRGRAKK